MLDALLAIPLDGWPETLDAFRRGLLAMADALRGGERREAVRDELRVFFERELAPLLRCRGETERTARRDAFNEVFSDGDGLAEALATAAGKLTPAARPNLISFLRAKVIWRSTDLLESVDRRHRRRMVTVPNPLSFAPATGSGGAAAIDRRALVGEIFDEFGQDPADAAVLVGLMQDLPIAEIARSTGRSRQQIYRLLERIRLWMEQQR
ncbi:MAG: hypothetical protein R3F65_23720 [bacterium]